MRQQQTIQQMTQGQPKETSANYNLQLGGKSELKKWANKIGPRSVAAAARYRNEPEAKQQERNLSGTALLPHPRHGRPRGS